MRKTVGWVMVGIFVGVLVFALEKETKSPAKPVTVVALVDGMT